jgi:hypothetical protein
MKIRPFFNIFVLAIFCMAVSAQSVVITGKKVTYKRPKPLVDFKKTFTVNYPKVKASTPALSRKIEAAISYDSNLEIRIKDELGDTQWLENADYEVGYNKNGILSIALSIEGTGAYPDGSTKYVVVDTRNGIKAKPEHVFTKLNGLLSLVNKAKDKEVATAIIEIKKDPENGDADIEAMFKNADKYNKVSLDQFSVSDKGVTFHHDYGFAHVAQGLQPPGEFFFAWNDLKPYIKPSGLLGQFVR